MRMDQLRIRLGIATAMVLGLGMGARTASAGLLVTVEPPGEQRTSVSGVTTEDFDGFTTGWRPSLTTAVGTISGDNLRILAADPRSVATLKKVLASEAYSVDARRVAATALSHLSPEALPSPMRGAAARAARGGPKGALARHLATLRRIRQ